MSDDIYKAAADKFVSHRDRELAWLAGLKVGAQVAIYRGYSNRVPEVTTITAQTSRYWEASHQRFRKDTGRKVGGSKWHSAWLSEVTPDIVDAAKRRALIQQLDAVRWAALSTEWLEAVATVLNEGMKVAQAQAAAAAKEM